MDYEEIGRLLIERRDLDLAIDEALEPAQERNRKLGAALFPIFPRERAELDDKFWADLRRTSERAIALRERFEAAGDRLIELGINPPPRALRKSKEEPEA